jgi:hypothetical protein
MDTRTAARQAACVPYAPDRKNAVGGQRGVARAPFVRSIQVRKTFKPIYQREVAMTKLHPALKMTYAEKMERADQKRTLLLNFLASGEVFTTIAIAAELLQLSEQTVQPMLKRLVAGQILRVDAKAVPFSKTKLWGITAHGLALTESSNPKCNEFRVGRTHPGFLEHHLDCQFVRIVMQRNGWTNWVPDKLLRDVNSKRLNKIPDGLAIRPDGCRVAIEVERNIKSKTRMQEMMAGHIQQFEEDLYDAIYYFTPHLAALKRVFQSVTEVKLNGRSEKVTEMYRSRFMLLDISELKNTDINPGNSVSNAIVDFTL